MGESRNLQGKTSVLARGDREKLYGKRERRAVAGTVATTGEGGRLTGRYIFRNQLMQSEGVGAAYRAWRREWRGANKEYVGLAWERMWMRSRTRS